jgi:N-hydroxyarylamine O-acetyltransferase
MQFMPGTAAMIDLDSYFARIGYAGVREPTLAVLKAIHVLHPAAIPFENLDPLLGRPVALDVPSVQDKLVHGKRGGYCFEQNALLSAVLEALGISVAHLNARVRWQAPPERPMSARTHMLLKLDVEGETYIADVGFGGLLQDVPLRLAVDVEQATAGVTFRYQREGEAYMLQARLAAGWHNVYLFTLEPQVAADYMVSNWFTSTHPHSRFRTNLLMERLLPDVRISLVDRKLTYRYRDGRIEQRLITDADALEAVVKTEFGVDSPASLHAVFERLPR